VVFEKGNWIPRMVFFKAGFIEEIFATLVRSGWV
jgi:hypothetical protein